MAKTLAVFRFELRHQLRRVSTFVYYLILLALCVMFLQVMAEDVTHFNAPYAIAVTVVFGSMLGLMIVAAFAGDAATRDLDVRIHPLVYSSPVGRPAYLLGRFFAAFTLSAAVFTALPLGAFLATWLPIVEPGRLGAFNASAHLRPYFIYALPNAFIATAFLFGLATLTRRAIASYAGAAFLFFLSMVCGKLLPSRMGWSSAKLLDPVGYTTIWEWWLSLNPIQKNAFVLPLNGAIVANRVFWIVLASTFLAIAYWKFRLAFVTAGSPGRWRKRSTRAAAEEAGTHPLVIPPARRTFDRSTRARQFVALTSRSFRDLHMNRVWWIVPLLAVFFVLNAPDVAMLEMGIPGPLTTARLLSFLSSDVSVLLSVLIALSAGELVWRDRAARMHPLVDVTPVPGWISLSASFSGLGLMLAVTMLIFLLAGLAVQASAGASHVDMPLYIGVLFGLLLPEYLLAAALAILIHTLVNQKYVANVLVILVPAAREIVQGIGVEDSLFLYGHLPAWTHSEIAGLGPTVEGRLWFTLYFSGWALLFALVSHLFRVRGQSDGVRERLARARRRFRGGAVAFACVAIAVILGTGGFIFHETHIRRESPLSSRTAQRGADYELRYGRYASLPQPTATAMKLHVEFYPKQRTARVRGSYRLENRSGADMHAIHVLTSKAADSTRVSFDRASRAALVDDEVGYRIYRLDRALTPGESLRMSFDVVIETDVFYTSGTPPVSENASFLTHRPRDGVHSLPLVGYRTFRELDGEVERRNYGLPERSPYPRLGEAAVGDETRGHEKVELETIVVTDAGQIGVAPGQLLRSWTRDGRSYAHYRTDGPISHAWSILAADYAVRRSEWTSPAGERVDVEIFHHPSHTANLDRMERSIRASLDYNSRNFGAYPHRQLRLVEMPSESYWLQMSAYDGYITYTEGFALVRPENDSRDVDFPFAVIAHEVGHQWWGHRLTPATVEGGPFLAESLAWYSGMLAVEEAYGREHLQRILGMMREQYMGPHLPRTIPLLRAVDHLDAYRRGPFAMYALREAAGVETVNAALRSLLEKFPGGTEPYPTTLDFYAALRAGTPPDLHGLLKDLFEEVTFWELRASGMDVSELENGRYRVRLRIEGAKLKGDVSGGQRPVDMHDRVEIVVDDAAGNQLYRGVHLIRSGAQTVELTVAGRPARAELDPDHELLDSRPDDNVVVAEP